RKLKQINGEVKEEEKTRRIEGWGILGKKAAQDVMDNITNAEELWEKGDYHLALPIVVKARKDYRELRKGWKPQVKEELDKFHALLDGSMLAAQAQECFRQCRDRASERKVEEAKTAFRQGEERLAEIPEAIQKYGFRELKNKQVAHVIEVIKPEAERILQVETNMYNIDTFLEQMNDYIKRESFSSADSLHMQIQQILPLIPVSERARRLRRKSLEMKDALEKAKHFTEAKRYHQEAVENLQERTLKSCDLAARRLSEARAITSKHLQGDDPEYVSFKEQLEAATTSQIRLQEDLRLFGAVQGKVVGTEGREGLYQEFLKDIIPEFEPGNAPNLEKLVAFRSQVMSQIGDLARVDQESVGADYNNIKSRLEGLKEEVERKEKDYIDERFDAAEVCIQGIKGEASEKEYSAQKSAAEKELMEARRVMSALSPEALTEKEDEEELSVQEKYDKLDRGIRDAYNTAEFVVQGRKAIKAELFEQARSILGMVPESKQAEVEKYIDVITLEVEYRADEKNYFWAVPNIGLNDKVVEGYRSGARTFRDSDGENPFPLVGILSDIERKNIKFEGAPVDEIKELLDQLGRKRIGKEEAKVEICDKVDALIEGIDAYLHTSGVGEKKLKREFAVKLGQAYVAAGFEELGNKYLQG
ncbi:MAG: hypothetical protein OEL54_05600, partial [Flavobacteriaceae bacterium]|nr:hypothetical protein [Flavobacteriaceae bacterium]